MIVKEYYATRADGVNLYSVKSDKSVYIREKNTGALYIEAVGVETASFEFEETDIEVKVELSDVSESDYIPSQLDSATEFALKYFDIAQIQDIDEKLKCSGLVEKWEIGSYSVGDVRNANEQTWECWTAHDNAIYPDINPNNPQTWANFWRPLHGKTAATARPWVKPQYGTTDMYHAGEYMVYTDGNTYECVSDTVYSPDEYAQAWRVVGESSEPDGGEGGESGGEEDVQEPPTEEYPAWVQPTGAHDAYPQGAKVSHNGKKWTSDVANNVWEPGVYGWTEVQ